jgi:hypothetical protein
MKTLNSVRLFLIASLLLYGCSLQEDFEYASKRDLIAVNGFLHPDSVIVISITQTAPYPKGDSVIPVEGASVKLYENDLLLGDIPYNAEKRAYTLNYYPKESHSYRLVVYTGGPGSLVAHTSIPVNARVEACYSLFPPGNNTRLNGLARFNTHIRRLDQTSVAWVTLTGKFFKSTPIEGPPYRIVDSTAAREELVGWISSTSSAIDPFNSTKDEGFKAYLFYLRLDPVQDVEEYQLDMFSGAGTYSYDQLGKLADALGQYVHVYTASEEYDRYLKNAMLNYLNSNLEADTPNPFAEQVVTYSNVEGGTGVFAGYTSVTIPVHKLKCQ